MAPEPLRAELTGPVQRMLKLAEVVAEHCEVAIGAPSPAAFPDGPFEQLDLGPVHDTRFGAALARFDVVVVQTLTSPRLLLGARRHARRLVVDLIAPVALEVAAGEDTPARRALTRWMSRALVAHLAAADLVLCTNDKQRDLLIGAALAAGLLAPSRPLDDRIVVVPYGVEPEPPRAAPSGLRSGALAGDGPIAVWGGGMWSWFDPMTAVRAIEQAREQLPELRLVFLGLEHPEPAVRAGHAALEAQVRAYVRERELGDAVHFRPRWLPRDEYAGCLMDADVAISLHGATLEGRFASRTRVLDYLAAGLPVVCTAGDTMSEHVARWGLGRVVAPGDAAGCARALAELAGNGAHRVDSRALEPLRWTRVAAPLVDYCLAEAPAAGPGTAAAALRAARDYPAFLLSLATATGARGIAAKARTRARRLLGR